MECHTTIPVVVHAYLAEVYPFLGYNSTNIPNKANSVPSINLDSHWVNLRHIPPVYLDQSFFLFLMDDIRAIFAVHSDTPALSNVPDDLVAGQGMTAISQTRQQVTHTQHIDAYRADLPWGQNFELLFSWLQFSA